MMFGGPADMTIGMKRKALCIVTLVVLMVACREVYPEQSAKKNDAGTDPPKTKTYTIETITAAKNTIGNREFVKLHMILEGSTERVQLACDPAILDCREDLFSANDKVIMLGCSDVFFVYESEDKPDEDSVQEDCPNPGYHHGGYWKLESREAINPSSQN